MPGPRRQHVVVTGAAGFIGSHLAEALLGQGREVVGVDAFSGQVPPAEKWANLSRLLGRPGFELHRLDLASVYGDAPSYPTTEESRTRPLSPYGVTKLAAEQLCQAYARPDLSEMTVAILRYFTVYGPRQRSDMAFRRFIEAALAGRPIVVYGDGGQTRDFTYVDDVVRANLLAMTAPVEGEAVNIGGGRRVSLAEALELIGTATGRRPRIDRRPPRPGDARHTGADGTRADALLGYRPETDLATGLPAQVASVCERRRATTR